MALNLLLAHSAQAQLPAVSRKDVHLYLLVGQSNMAGRGRVEDTDRQPNSHVWMLTKENQWVPATEPLHFDKPEAGVGPGLAFGRVMAEADTSALIGLIPCAVGGSAIDSWTLGGYHDQTKSYPYDDALRRAKLALQAGTLYGILWHQGESDSKLGLAEGYADKLSGLIARFRKELKAKRVPVVVGTLGDFYVGHVPQAAIVNDAIRTVAKREKQVGLVESTGLNDKGDKTHFDASATRELGRRYAEAMLKLQAKIE